MKDLIISIFWLALFYISGVTLAIYNLYILRKTKQERLEIRRIEKKIKNRLLAKKLGIKYDK